MFCQYQQTRIALLTLVSLRCGFKLLSGLYTGFVRLLVGLHHDGLYLARSPSFTVCFYLVVLPVWRVSLAVYLIIVWACFARGGNS